MTSKTQKPAPSPRREGAVVKAHGGKARKGERKQTFRLWLPDGPIVFMDDYFHGRGGCWHDIRPKHRGDCPEFRVGESPDHDRCISPPGCPWVPLEV
jgi:hypothetical protein